MIRPLSELLRAVRFGGSLDPGPEEIVSMGVGGAAAGRVRQFRLQSVGDDHLVCRTLVDGVLGADDVFVAKPEELRKTPWHGKTIDGWTYTYTGTQSRNAVQGTTTESQVVVPKYLGAITNYAGTVIYAVRPVGGTGVTIGGEKVVWQEVSARAWAKV